MSEKTRTYRVELYQVDKDFKKIGEKACALFKMGGRDDDFLNKGIGKAWNIALADELTKAFFKLFREKRRQNVQKK